MDPSGNIVANNVLKKIWKRTKVEKKNLPGYENILWISYWNVCSNEAGRFSKITEMRLHWNLDWLLETWHSFKNEFFKGWWKCAFWKRVSKSFSILQKLFKSTLYWIHCLLLAPYYYVMVFCYYHVYINLVLLFIFLHTHHFAIQ